MKVASTNLIEKTTIYNNYQEKINWNDIGKCA
jgi:hypothetical protein